MSVIGEDPRYLRAQRQTPSLGKNGEWQKADRIVGSCIK